MRHATCPRTPRASTGPLSLLSRADRHLAGPGSPRVLGVDPEVDGVNAASNQGRNKRVAILPQAFSWALGAAPGTRLPACVTHWTPWVAQSPYASKQG